MAKLRDQPRTQSATFVLAPGARCYFYLTGTLTPAPVYAAPDIRADPLSPGAWLFKFETEHPNPLRSDSAARLPPVYLNPAITYRMRMLDAGGNLLHDLDPFTFFKGPAAITPVDDGGAVMPFSVLTVYLSRTTEIVGTYTADAAGVFADVTLDDSTIYRVKLEKADGTLVYDVDPVPGNGVSIAGGGQPATFAILIAARASSGTSSYMTSADGTNWTLRTNPTSNTIAALCWSPALGLVVSVGHTSIQSSPDGSNWTDRTSPLTVQWSDICWSEELNLFVAVHGTGGTQGAATSPDGITWTPRTTPDRQWGCVRWLASAGLFAAGAVVGSGFGDPNMIMTSPDGTNWTLRPAPLAPSLNSWKCYRMTVNGGYFAISSRSEFEALTSPDGITWTRRPTGLGGSAHSGIDYGEGVLVMTRPGTTGTKHAYSLNNGVTWADTAALNNGSEGLAYSPELGLFASSGSGASNGQRASRSLDGIAWANGVTPAGADSPIDWNSMCAASLPLP